MNETERKNPSRKALITVAVYAVLFFLIVALSNLEAINAFLAKVLDVLAPVLLGLALAYLINPLFRLFERRVLLHVKPHAWRRVLALLLTYAVLFAVIAGLLLLIIPQLIDSITTFAGNINGHLDSLIGQINSLIEKLNAWLAGEGSEGAAIEPLDRESVLRQLGDLWNSLLSLLKDSVSSGSLSHIVSVLSQTASLVTDGILALFVSLYLLSTKELRAAQVSRLRVAYLPERINRALTKILSIVDKSFGGFLRGKILDSAIVGCLVYLFCTIVRIPNALLIAVTVGVTDIIPVIGPFIGVIPSALIILLTDPFKVVLFLIAILVIQQIDGNIIAPKILGENTGISSLCVLIAIIVMSDLWGLVGALVGVPLFATILELLKIWIGRRLDSKALPSETESYYAKDTLNATPDSARGQHTLRRLRRRAVAESEPYDGGAGALSPTEHLRLGTFSLAVQHGLFTGTDVSEEDLAAFAADTEVFLKKMTETQAEEPPQSEISDSEAPSTDENADTPVSDHNTEKGDETNHA